MSLKVSMVTDASDGKVGLKLAASVPCTHPCIFFFHWIIYAQDWICMAYKVWDAISLYKRSVISSTQDVKVSGQGPDSREGEKCMLAYWQHGRIASMLFSNINS